MRVNFTLLDQNKKPLHLTETIPIKLVACKAGEIVRDNGTCALCEGPDSYLLNTGVPAATRIPVKTCSTCNFFEGVNKDNIKYYKDVNINNATTGAKVFTCHGGQNISSAVGFQNIQKDSITFAKCDDFLGQPLCYTNNTCRVGYDGLMCKQCAKNFYRDFDGQC